MLAIVCGRRCECVGLASRSTMEPRGGHTGSIAPWTWISQITGQMLALRSTKSRVMATVAIAMTAVVPAAQAFTASRVAQGGGLRLTPDAGFRDLHTRPKHRTTLASQAKHPQDAVISSLISSGRKTITRLSVRDPSDGSHSVSTPAPLAADMLPK